MTREELILDCRYYNGEEDAPETFTDWERLLWSYEETWVRWVLENNPSVQKNIDYYTKQYDLPSILPYEKDGTPLGIKAILWNRCDHWSGYPGTAKSFIRWYQEQYVKDTKTHRQLLNR